MKLKMRMQKTFEEAIEKIKKNLSAFPKKIKPFITNILEHRIIILDYQIGKIYTKLQNQSLHQYKERSFIRGFMKHNDAYRFIEWVNINTDKIAYCVHVNSAEEFEREYYEGDMTASHEIIVSIEGININDSIKYIPYVKTPTVLAKSIIDYDKTRAYLHSSVDVDMIVCIDPVYGRLATSTGGLYNDILEGLKKIK